MTLENVSHVVLLVIAVVIQLNVVWLRHEKRRRQRRAHTGQGGDQ